MGYLSALIKTTAGLAAIATIGMTEGAVTARLNNDTQLRSHESTTQLIPPPTLSANSRTGTIPPPVSSDAHQSQSDPVLPPPADSTATTAAQVLLPPPSHAELKDRDKGTIPPPAAAMA